MGGVKDQYSLLPPTSQKLYHVTEILEHTVAKATGFATCLLSKFSKHLLFFSSVIGPCSQGQMDEYRKDLL